MALSCQCTVSEPLLEPESLPHCVMGLPARGGPGLGASGAAQTNRCSWIISSHEKQTAIKPKASRDREFYINESQ